MRNTQGGAIRFDYGARTNYIAVGLAEAEARRIIAILAKALPDVALSHHGGFRSTDL